MAIEFLDTTPAAGWLELLNQKCNKGLNVGIAEERRAVHGNRHSTELQSAVSTVIFAVVMVTDRTEWPGVK